MEPEAVPPRDYKGFDPTFGKWVKSRGQPAEPTMQRAKPGSILKADLPSDRAIRLERLRAHAGGKLPRFDRYQAGEHRQVWRELVSLGPAVREDAHAADALAVAYETMRRVDQNVRTVVQRLTAMTARDTTASHARTSKPGERGSTSRAHVPPGPNARKEVADFEKEFGTLPLSLRVFYEVVGEVNLNGTHAAIDPPGNSVAPEMAIPDPRADGELLNERHNLFFVDYLRLCFEYGGFPGYDGQRAIPAELESLKEGLVEF